MAKFEPTNVLQSLSGSSNAGPGEVLMLTSAKAFASMQVFYHYSPPGSVCPVLLEGSLDGVNFFPLHTGPFAWSNSVTAYGALIAGPCQHNAAGNIVGYISSWTVPVLYLRANLLNSIIGTVDVFVAAA